MHRKNPNRKFSLRFGKEETSTEDKKPCLQGFVPSWSFLTRLRRPYLFSRKRKDRGEKSVWMRLVHSASEFRREPIFQASFHTIVTLRASYYAPPDTGVPNLQLVALEYLLKIEDADQICWSAPFCGEAFLCLLRPYRMHPMASPMRGSCRREATDEVGQLRKRKTPTSSVSASPSHLPWKGRWRGAFPLTRPGMSRRRRGWRRGQPGR